MRPVRVNFSAGRLERGMPMTVSYVGSGTVRRKTERRSLNRQSRKTGTMNTKAEIQTMLAAYTARYPDERAAMEPFVRYVASFDAPALYDRKNFVGHLTAGALIRTGITFRPARARARTNIGISTCASFPVRRRFSGRDRPGRVGRLPLGYA